MRVVALVQDINYCSWWRIEQPFRFLKDNGVDTEICWLNSNQEPLVSIKDAVVVLHRIIIKGGSDEQPGQWVGSLKKLGARKVVYELDDDVISENYVKHMEACGRASLTSLSQLEDERRRQVLLIQACDEVTVSTEALNRLVSNVTRVPVHVLPNSMNIEWYTIHLNDNSVYQNKNNDSFQHRTIGWAGGLRPESDFAELAEAWSYIDKKYPDVRFIIGGWQPNTLWKAVDYDKIIRIPWANLDNWPQTMQVDIGCVPLQNTEFNRCKSPIKALEYVMAGALPIASPTVYNIKELNTLPISNSVNGWKYFIEYHLNNWLDRQLYVQAIQEQVRKHFDLSKNWVKWQEAYEN